MEIGEYFYSESSKLDAMETKNTPSFVFVWSNVRDISTFPNLYVIQDSGLMVSVQYIGGNALLILLFEKAGVNEIKAHFSLGILLIVSGLLIDFIFVQ